MKRAAYNDGKSGAAKKSRTCNNDLFDALRDSDAEKALAAINKGANVNAPNNDGNTPLHFALLKGHAAAAKLLIKNDANVNATNNRGETPLHFTFKYGFNTNNTATNL